MTNEIASNMNTNDYKIIRETIARVGETVKPLLDALQGLGEWSHSLIETFEQNKEQISKVLKGIRETGRILYTIEMLGEAQFVWWDYFTRDILLEFELSDDTNNTLRQIAARDKYRKVNETIEKTIANPAMAKHIRLYTQCVKAFQAGDCDLAVVGFTAVFDGLLSVVSNNTDHKLPCRLKIIEDKLATDDALDQEEYAVLALAWTFQSTMKTFAARSDFNGPEPEELNRHWIAHGRAYRNRSELDCVKMINMIYGLLLLGSSESTGESEESVGEYV